MCQPKISLVLRNLFKFCAKIKEIIAFKYFKKIIANELYFSFENLFKMYFFCHFEDFQAGSIYT